MNANTQRMAAYAGEIRRLRQRLHAQQEAFKEARENHRRAIKKIEARMREIDAEMASAETAEMLGGEL